MTLVKFGNCWIFEMDEAWKKLKKRLTEASILRHPDFIKPFILYTDASKKGVITSGFTLQRCKVTILHLLDCELHCLKLTRDYVTILTNYKSWIAYTTKVS